MAANRNLQIGDDAGERIRKLLPAEVSGGFLAINAAAPPDAEWYWMVIAVLILGIACWIYLQTAQGVTRLLQKVFITCVAFPAWAAAIAIERISFFDDPNRWIAPVMLILVSVFLPIFAKP